MGDSTGGMALPSPNPLASYLLRRGLTQDAFARLVGTTGPVVCRWATGSRIPSLPFAVQIARVTRGVVPVAYWVDQAEARRRAA